MSRFLPHLAEQQPAMFAEISTELAESLGIENGDDVCLLTMRGAIQVNALVTRRIQPLQLNGRCVHQVAVPFHFGNAGLVIGDAANDLVAISGEPNVTIMEAKALLCNIIPGQLPRGRDFDPWFRKHVPQGGPPNLHPEQPPPGAPEGGKLTAGHGQHGKSG
jgi:formate dehydrogenase major subunit